MKCPKCSNSVSDQDVFAGACPHCGAKFKKSATTKPAEPAQELKPQKTVVPDSQLTDERRALNSLVWEVQDLKRQLKERQSPVFTGFSPFVRILAAIILLATIFYPESRVEILLWTIAAVIVFRDFDRS